MEWRLLVKEGIPCFAELRTEIFINLWGGGRTNERPGTDHVTSGPMRGLKKTASNGANKQTSGHGDSLTESAQWGRFSENV